MSDDESRVRPNAGKFWAWVPAGLLSSMLLGLGSLAYIAADDPGFALEPNYYDKAVRWDEAQAEARESLASGFRLELTKPLCVDPRGDVELSLSVTDRDGLPVANAEVTVEAFANAAASRVERVVLRQIAPGAYRANISRGIAGLWELRLAVRKGALRYKQVMRRDVTRGPSA